MQLEKSKTSNAPRLYVGTTFAQVGSLLPSFGLHLDRFKYPVQSILNSRRMLFIWFYMFWGTQDRESNVDSRWHPHQGASFLHIWKDFYKFTFSPLHENWRAPAGTFSIFLKYGFAHVRLLFCGQVLPFGAGRDSRSAGSIRRAPARGASRVGPMASKGNKLIRPYIHKGWTRAFRWARSCRLLSTPFLRVLSASFWACLFPFVLVLLNPFASPLTFLHHFRKMLGSISAPC